jgi:TatD DNase family protein
VTAPGAAALLEVSPLTVPVFDAHTHLDAIARRADAEPDAAFVAQVMAQARTCGVIAAVTVADSLASARWGVAAARAHPDVYSAVGVHPTEVAALTEGDYAELETLARDPRVVAVGETGLDYHWDRTTPQEQAVHFRRHIELAKTVGKPLMIHDRLAHEDVLRILREQGAPEQVIFHSFSGDEAMARQCVAAGYTLSFSGVISFKNAPALRAAAAVTPLELMLVETDAPFLTPHPYRGHPNAPRMLPLTVRALASAAGTTPEQLAAATVLAGHQLFGMPRFDGC